MRVGVDGRSLEGVARGVGHYTAALLAALRQEFPRDEYVVAGRRPRAAYVAGALVGRPALVGDCDVLWLPAPAPVATGRVPYVLTVHDRAWEERPGDFTPYERLWHAVARPRRLARGAARVIADTDVLARDLRAAWGVDATPIPLAARPLRRDAAAGPPSGTRPYVLFVGALEPRKAPDVLAAAMPDGLDLRVVGSGRVAVPGAILESDVDDDRLAELYAGAAALAMPSRLEGFGLPAVEALAFGTPVIASDLPVLREVLGDRATFVAPEDVAAWRAALSDLPPRREPYAGRTWSDVARETRTVLAGAAGC